MALVYFLFLLSVLFLSVVYGFYLNIYLMIKIAGIAIITNIFCHAVSSVRHAKLGLSWNIDASFFLVFQILLIVLKGEEALYFNLALP